MNINNKGYTLTELLVSTVIFGIVLVSVFGFMLAGAKSYNKVNDRLEIQNQSQMALNLIEEYVIDSVGGIYFDVNTLYILRAPTTTTFEGVEVTSCVVDVFRLNKADHVLRYAEASAELEALDEKTGISVYDLTLPEESKFYELTKDVQLFEVQMENDGDGIYTISAEITLGLKNRSADYEGTKKVALRNRPGLVTIS